MATPPKTSDELLRLVEQSGLVEPAALKSFILREKSDSQSPKDAATIAKLLLERKLMTRFQVNQILLGRHRGFFVARYKILDLLGVGAMGKVYLAEHAFMRRQVALKILPKTTAAEPSSIGRFHREARAIAALNHPNIVQAYDFDQADGVLFIVMEYVNGKSVQEFVQSHGPIPWGQAVDYAAQTAAGLQHASEAGVIHRDIKPANLLLDRSGVVKILDMGLARVFGELGDPEGQALSIMYNERVLGTADYLAPEQAIDSHNVDVRADIYSLGLTLYYMLTGQMAAPNGSVPQKLIWHQKSEPASVRSIRSEIPEGVEAILSKMIAKNPSKRYQTPEAARAALAAHAIQVTASFDSGSDVTKNRNEVDSAAVRR
jgi:serine/threonine protein kinase